MAWHGISQVKARQETRQWRRVVGGGPYTPFKMLACFRRFLSHQTIVECTNLQELTFGTLMLVCIFVAWSLSLGVFVSSGLCLLSLEAFVSVFVSWSLSLGLRRLVFIVWSRSLSLPFRYGLCFCLSVFSWFLYSCISLNCCLWTCSNHRVRISTL